MQCNFSSFNGNKMVETERKETSGKKKKFELQMEEKVMQKHSQKGIPPGTGPPQVREMA